MLEGVDVSVFNGPPSLSGLDFLFARSSYGNGVDSGFAHHISRAKTAGLVTGAYHFGNGLSTPAEQAALVLRTAKDVPLIVLDLERDTSKTMTPAEAGAFIRAIHVAGRRIGLYHSRSGFPSLGQDYNWVAQWGTAPPSGIAWAFWQYQGIRLDRDRFNGNLVALHHLANLPSPVIPPPTKLVPPLVHVRPGTWWDYTVTGNKVDGYHVSRVSKPTTGFSAQVTDVWTDKNGAKIVFGSLPRSLAKLTTGVYHDHWVDLDDTPSVTYIPKGT